MWKLITLLRFKKNDRGEISKLFAKQLKKRFSIEYPNKEYLLCKHILVPIIENSNFDLVFVNITEYLIDEVYPIGNIIKLDNGLDGVVIKNTTNKSIAIPSDAISILNTFKKKIFLVRSLRIDESIWLKSFFKIKENNDLKEIDCIEYIINPTEPKLEFKIGCDVEILTGNYKGWKGKLDKITEEGAEVIITFLGIQQKELFKLNDIKIMKDD